MIYSATKFTLPILFSTLIATPIWAGKMSDCTTEYNKMFHQETGLGATVLNTKGKMTSGQKKIQKEMMSCYQNSSDFMQAIEKSKVDMVKLNKYLNK